MDTLKGKHPDDVIAGYEANGGFLLGSEARVNNRPLMALPTRDAILPMLALLGLSKDTNREVSQLTKSLPMRYTASDRLQDISNDISQQLVASLVDNPEAIIDVLLPNATQVLTIDRTDGLRVEFDTGDIVHLRPSGNAPELRCYAESNDHNLAVKICTSCLNRIKKALQ
jgi:phosphomannomutase